MPTNPLDAFLQFVENHKTIPEGEHEKHGLTKEQWAASIRPLTEADLKELRRLDGRLEAFLKRHQIEPKAFALARKMPDHFFGVTFLPKELWEFSRDGTFVRNLSSGGFESLDGPTVEKDRTVGGYVLLPDEAYDDDPEELWRARMDRLAASVEMALEDEGARTGERGEQTGSSVSASDAQMANLGAKLRRGMTKEKANERALELAKTDATFVGLGIREMAQRIGCSHSTLSATPFWKCLMQKTGRGRAAGSPKAVSLSDAMLRTLKDRKSATLDELIREQEADAASERFPRRKKV